MNPSLLIFITFVFTTVTANQALKCTVCKSVVKEFITAIKKVDPLKKIEVGSFRIDPDGNQKKSKIQYAGSEVHLNEVMETLCDTMEDYAQAKHKGTGEIYLLKLTEDMDKIKDFDFVPDPDLNKGLKFTCENLISEYDEDLIMIFKGNLNPDLKATEAAVCADLTDMCRLEHEEL